MWANNNIMKEVEHMHAELIHFASKDYLTWDEYSLFLSVTLPLKY